MLFIILIIWRESKDYISNYHFCMMFLQYRILKKRNWTINYSNIFSITRPISHGNNFSLFLVEYILGSDKNMEIGKYHLNPIKLTSVYKLSILFC